MYTIRKLPSAENPSCRHVTWASSVFHESSHTVPHRLLMHISTLPSVLLPPISLTSPTRQGTGTNRIFKLSTLYNVKINIDELHN